MALPFDRQLMISGNRRVGNRRFAIGRRQRGDVVTVTIENGDVITIDAEKNEISVDLSDAEIEKRRSKWKQPALKVKRGSLYKYAKTVSSASKGCVTDEF